MDGIRHIWQFGHGYFKSVGTDSVAPGAPAGTRAEQAARLAAAIRTALGTGAQEGSLITDTGEPIGPDREHREGLYAVGGSRSRFEVAVPLADAVDGPALKHSLALLLSQDDNVPEAHVCEGVSPAAIVGWWVDGTRLIADRAFLAEGSRTAFALADELGLPCVYSFARDEARSVRTLTGGKRMGWAQDAWADYNMFRRATSPANSLPGTGEPVDTGLRDLDQTLDGLHPGSLTIVAGRRGAGKTSFALTLAANAAKQGTTVLYFSLELSADDAAGCLLCAEARTPIADARRGMLADDERYFLNEAAQRLEQFDLAFIDDTETYKDICAEARRRLDGNKRKALVIVDDLQPALAWPDDGSPRDEALAAAAQAFKALARNVHAPVVVASQLTHAIEGRPDKRPTLADLPGMGTLEQDADTVLLIDRSITADEANDEYFERPPLGTANIIVAINKLGQSNVEIPVAFIMNRMTIRDLI